MLSILSIMAISSRNSNKFPLPDKILTLTSMRGKWHWTANMGPRATIARVIAAESRTACKWSLNWHGHACILLVNSRKSYHRQEREREKKKIYIWKHFVGLVNDKDRLRRYTRLNCGAIVSVLSKLSLLSLYQYVDLLLRHLYVISHFKDGLCFNLSSKIATHVPSHQWRGPKEKRKKRPNPPPPKKIGWGGWYISEKLF